MSDVNTPTDEAIKLAREKGFTVVESDEYTLLLDIDSDADYAWLAAMLPILNSACPNMGALIREEWLSKSGTHRHVKVSVCELLSVEERVLLQAVLGSDRKRELLAYSRILKGVRDNNISTLFRPPAEGN